MVEGVLRKNSGFYFTQPDNVVMFDEVLTQTAKVVYCALLKHVKRGTQRCQLYVGTIAEEIKKSVRTVRRCLTELCNRGVIVRLMQYGSRKNQLASIFFIVGRNAACYAEGASASPESSLQSSAAQTKTSAVPDLSYPPDKNSTQNNDKCENKNYLKDTLIGQGELPKSSFSSLAPLKPSHKVILDGNQYCFDFEEACDEAKAETTNRAEQALECSEVVSAPIAESVSTIAKDEQPMTTDCTADCTDVAGNAADSCEEVSFDPLDRVANSNQIPHDMLDTARYFLYRTQRDPRTINDKEIQAMREVFEKHYPARIQKEIDTACKRFVNNGRRLSILRFGYIAASLRKQRSLVSFEKMGQSYSQTPQTSHVANSANSAPVKATPPANNRYLTSEDLKGKTNTLAHLSMEEILAMADDLDREDQKKEMRQNG